MRKLTAVFQSGADQLKQHPSSSILYEIALLLAGSVISAFAVNVFYVPTRLTMGGISGIVSIIFQLTKQGAFLSFGGLFLLLNIPLLLLGKRLISTRFMIRSIIGSVVYSVMIDLTAVPFGRFYDHFLGQPLARGTPDPLIYCLFGGVIYGFGLGLVFRGGYTTGGTDIVALIFSRKLHQFSIGQFILLLDAAIVLSSAFAYRYVESSSLLMAMYSFIAMYLTSKSIDILLEGFEYCRTAYIISDHSDEIAEEVLSTLGRGVTALHGHGMYTGAEKQVLMCVISKKQVPDIKRIVCSIDPTAFVIVSEAREVLGKGFSNSMEL